MGQTLSGEMKKLKSEIEQLYSDSKVAVGIDQDNHGQPKGFKVFGGINTIHVEKDESSSGYHVYGSTANDEIDEVMEDKLSVYRFFEDSMIN